MRWIIVKNFTRYNNLAVLNLILLFVYNGRTHFILNLAKICIMYTKHFYGDTTLHVKVRIQRNIFRYTQRMGILSLSVLIQAICVVTQLESWINSMAEFTSIRRSALQRCIYFFTSFIRDVKF